MSSSYMDYMNLYKNLTNQRNQRNSGRAMQTASRQAPQIPRGPGRPAIYTDRYAGQPGTFEQMVYNNSGQHAGTLHFRDGDMYEKSWVVDEDWKTGRELDRMFGPNHQYQDLPDHTYGRLVQTSRPKVKQEPNLMDLLAADRASSEKKITDILKGMQTQMKGYQDMMKVQQEGYQKSLAGMVNVIKESKKVEQSKPKVLGVRVPGKRDPMTIKKTQQGVKGTFGREGLRIKGLNV